MTYISRIRIMTIRHAPRLAAALLLTIGLGACANGLSAKHVGSMQPQPPGPGAPLPANNAPNVGSMSAAPPGPGVAQPANTAPNVGSMQPVAPGPGTVVKPAP